MRCCRFPTIHCLTSPNTRYVKDRRARQLTECVQNIEHRDAEIKRLSEDIETARTTIAEIEKEINASGASVANYRDNIRVRKLAKEIIETQTEMDACDMDGAAKAERNFQEKYPQMKERENRLHTNVSEKRYGGNDGHLNIRSIPTLRVKSALISLSSKLWKPISRSSKTSTKNTRNS